MAIAWVAPENMEHPEWVAAGLSLGEMGRVNNWWVGDWLHYGNARWGEKYSEAARITGLDGKTLRNIAYVTSRFDLSRRRDKLHFTHHAEVAALDPGQQDVWLDRAIELKLSAADLRLALKTDQRGLKAADDTDDNCAEVTPTTDFVVCPQCGFKLLPEDEPETDDPGESG